VHGAQDFLKALTTVLAVAAVTTVLFQRLRQPVVLGYILAGLIVGPHVPIPLVADVATVQTLSELGVILLMFSLGLEFSVRKLVEVGPTAGLAALIQSSIMVWLGFIAGRAFGWSVIESVFAGGIVAISSTTIIAKAFDELRIRGRLRELVVGILIVEDLIGILLMAVLTAVAKGGDLGAGELAWTVERLALFLATLVGAGFLVVPRAIRAVRRLDRPETTLVASLGLCFGIALLAMSFGYSVALGAFIAGSLVAESGEEHHIQHLVQPVRDMFAAVFFVSVGMLIEPRLVLEHWGAVAVFTALVVLGKLAGVGLGAFVAGNGVRTSVRAGMSLAQIGEFSFIIAALGLSLRATRDFLYPIAVTVSALTTLTTPWLIRASEPVASFVDRKLPRPLQTVAALYGSWLEQVRTAPRRATVGARVRRILRVLLVDAAVLVAIVIATSTSLTAATTAVRERLGSGEALARYGLIALAALASVPFWAGLLRNARRLAETLAVAALPEEPDGPVDLAVAPRRAFIAIFQLATVIVVSVTVIAVTQPFVPAVPGAVLLLVHVAVLGVAFWRSATQLQGHVRAGAQVIVEALAKGTGARARSGTDALEQMRALLPGLGEPVAVTLSDGSPGVGRTLAALDLRGVTGAIVLAISRRDGGVLVPSALEVLQAGDILALAGTKEAVDAARALLEPEATVEPARLARTGSSERST
jgi:CPA2 family monovalent cation:H+ antiporter-2